MNSFLSEYVERGLSGIFQIDGSFHESEAGYGSQDATAIIVARRGGDFVKMAVHEHAWFGFNSGRNFKVVSEEVITEDLYLELSKDKAAVDTPDDVEALKAQHVSLLRRYDAQDKLNAIDHRCSDCGSRMTYRSSKYGPFWGCAKYPACTATRRMSAEEDTLYRQWAGE